MRKISLFLHKATFVNWKTTTIGFIMAGSAFIVRYPQHFGGQGTVVYSIADFCRWGGFGALGLVSADTKKHPTEEERKGETIEES